MNRIKLLPGWIALSVLALGASSALAAPPGTDACSGGTLAPGVYDGLTVTGTCTVMGDVTINGNVTVKPNAYLDAAYLETKLTVNGNIDVGRNAKLGLGCSFGYHDCLFNPAAWEGNVVVNGNVVANQALTMFIDFTTIHGNLIANGGGDIALVDPHGLVFPIKDNVIDGNVMVHGWQGAWFGIIRNTVGGNVMLTNTAGTRLGDAGTPDSNEIATNIIAGNLVCQGNSPQVQIGDSGGSINNVSGNKIGECTKV
jgi:hypothetical protein